MKRIIVIVLCIVLLCGCSVAKDIREPVSVYYRTSQISYGAEEGLIGSEKREFYNRRNELKRFLNEYLSGPNTQKLSSPFPVGASVLEVTESETNIKLMLNLPFLQLTASQLTLAYACISMTLFEVTDVQTVDLYIWGTDYEMEHTVVTRGHLHFADVQEIE